MDNSVIQVIYGEGQGKTSAAIGKSILAAGVGHNVIFIRFLKGNRLDEYRCIERLEPDIKIFCFEKETLSYDELDESKREEEAQNIMNGFHFANKVAETGECDMLVLDEVLGMIDLGMISIQDIYRLIERCGNHTSLIMTGKYMPKELIQHIDVVSEIKLVKNES